MNGTPKCPGYEYGVIKPVLIPESPKKAKIHHYPGGSPGFPQGWVCGTQFRRGWDPAGLEDPFGNEFHDPKPSSELALGLLERAVYGLQWG